MQKPCYLRLKRRREPKAGERHRRKYSKIADIESAPTPQRIKNPSGGAVGVKKSEWCAPVLCI